jgi:Spy/CpxP family protein refolding chaperone
MTRLKTTHFALSVLLAGTALAAVMPAQAQPMMGDAGMYHDSGRMHERMAQHWEKRQTELKAKLHLTPAQEPAWNAFVQGMKVPAKPLAQPIDREALAKLSTPERLEKMNAVHEANLAAMQTHIKERNEATRTFYGQLSAEQKKVFDAETLPEHSRWKGKRD